MSVAKKENFWFGKKVLVTGQRGFKGSWDGLLESHYQKPLI